MKQWCWWTVALHFPLWSQLTRAARSKYLLEGLLPSVCPDVIVESCGTSKGTTTVATLERPVAGVCNYVVPQLRRLGERLGAVTTLVGPAMGKRNTVLSVLSVDVSRKLYGQEHLFFPAISKENCGCTSLWLFWEKHNQNFMTSLVNVKCLSRNCLRVYRHHVPQNMTQQAS